MYAIAYIDIQSTVYRIECTLRNGNRVMSLNLRTTLRIEIYDNVYIDNSLMTLVGARLNT